MAFLVRLVTALVVVFATYNPEGRSFYHWVMEGGGSLPLKAFLGVVLAIAWIFLLNSARASLGSVGLLLAAAFFGTLIWLVLSAAHWSAQSGRAITYIVEVALAGVLSVGLVWSRFRQRVTGQVDVQDGR